MVLDVERSVELIVSVLNNWHYHAWAQWWQRVGLGCYAWPRRTKRIATRIDADQQCKRDVKMNSGA